VFPGSVNPARFVTEGAKLQARAGSAARRPAPIDCREATVSRMMTRLCAITIALAVIWGSRSAAAQAVEATRPDSPLLMGPLQLFPSLTLRDIGIDSNVYNESVRHEDFTYTVSPTLKTVLPIGESRLTTRGALDFRYFQTHKDQQSTSGSLNTQLEVGSGRVRPFGTAGLVRSHERGGYDIDRRAYSLASQVKAGASLALTPVTSITGWIVRESTRFDRLELFDGVSLSQQYACGGGANRNTGLPRANEIVCFRLDGSMQALVVAPNMTDLNAAGGGSDAYSKRPKGNIDPTGEYFLWASNMGGNRADVFIVRIPTPMLGVAPSATTPAPSPTPAPAPSPTTTSPSPSTPSSPPPGNAAASGCGGRPTSVPATTRSATSR